MKLTVEGNPKKITVRNLSDDPSRRFFKSHPAAIMSKAQTVTIAYQEDRE